MDVPAHSIPTRKEWRKFRDNAGGKSGMAKVNVGSALDSFHKLYAKTAKKEDPTPLVKEITTLSKTVNTYIATVSKTSKDVANAAKDKLKKPIDKFAADLTKMATAQAKELNKQVKNLDALVYFVKRNCPALEKKVNKFNETISQLQEKYRRGVPEGEKDKVRPTLQKLHKQAVDFDQGAQSLQTEFQTRLTTIDSAIRDSRKKDVKAASELIRVTRNLTVGTMSRTGDLVKKV